MTNHDFAFCVNKMIHDTGDMNLPYKNIKNMIVSCYDCLSRACYYDASFHAAHCFFFVFVSHQVFDSQHTGDDKIYIRKNRLNYFFVYKSKSVRINIKWRNVIWWRGVICIIYEIWNNLFFIRTFQLLSALVLIGKLENRSKSESGRYNHTVSDDFFLSICSIRGFSLE